MSPYSLPPDRTLSRMIASFRHKGLRLLFETGERRLLNPQHVEKIENILGVLQAAENIKGVDVPGYRLHTLSGDLKGLWSVTVRANWRIVFRFEGGKAFDVDLLDYH
jgi:proteic killer suppression protein